MEDNKVTKPPVMLYTEQTPNPETLKFVTNLMIYPRKMADFKEEQKELANEWSPLAKALFEFDYVKGIYICNNFVTVTKEASKEWADISMDLKKFIKSFIESDNIAVKEGFEEEQEKQKAAQEEVYSGEDAEIVTKIKQLLDKYVRPAVEMDGGNIEFHSFDDGVVNVIMQGSCSGCPSSSGTLKVGIEGMLKRMCPEVKSVEAIMG
jgi:Fe-S cluster biogenesis protein NfuA